MFRAKARWVEQGEKATKLIFLQPGEKELR